MLNPSPGLPADIEALITEDDTPVDNLPSEKQQRLLTEPLYSCWSGPGENRPFLAAANVGVFAETGLPAIVPDMFISLDVRVPQDWWVKLHRSYFIQEYGKPPDLVLEIVSNLKGEENADKRQKYTWMRIPYYVIYDPVCQLMTKVLTVYRLRGLQYEVLDNAWFPELNLGLALWKGEFEDRTDSWLRWTDAEGVVIPTGREQAGRERLRAEQERQRAEQEHVRAESANQRAAQADQRAEQAEQRAEQERRQAEQERLRAEQADQRAEQERLRAEHLAALLRQAGIEIRE